MKRFIFFIFFSNSLVSGFSQSIKMTFESLNLPIDTFWNGSDLSGAYLEPIPLLGDTFIAHNSYDTAWGGYWSGGIAVSTMSDDTTENFTNLYSSIAASGYNSSSYGVVSGADTATISTTVMLWGDYQRFMSMYVSNATYTYYSMLNGDAFAKKFGGSTGNDPDYLFIRFYFYGGFPKQHVDFYLADFRNEDNSQDYILDDWVYVDFNDYPNSEHYGPSIKMQLFSSDTGAFGMNTPAFFCIDNLEIGIPGGVSNAKNKTDETFISVKEKSINAQNQARSNFILLSLSGQVIQKISDVYSVEFNTQDLPQGVYILKTINTNGEFGTKVFRW